MKENIFREHWQEFGAMALFLLVFIFLVLPLVCSPEPLPAQIFT